MKTTYTEIKGSVPELRKLSREHGFKYVAGDRVFRRKHGSDVSIRAYRLVRSGINAQRQRMKRAA
jgi:hypothetical protein